MFEDVEWWREQELEIPEEDEGIEERIEDPLNTPSRSVSTSTNEMTILSPNAGAGEPPGDGLQSVPPRPLGVPKNSDSVSEWVCGHPNCGRPFTHRFRLKYVPPT